MVILNLISYVLVLLGSLNWALVGWFNVNLLDLIFGGYRSVGAIIVYSLIFAAAIWLIVSPILTRGKLYLKHHEVQTREHANRTYKENA